MTSRHRVLVATSTATGEVVGSRSGREIEGGGVGDGIATEQTEEAAVATTGGSNQVTKGDAISARHIADKQHLADAEKQHDGRTGHWFHF